jgi:small subunit ribosomal protein S14
MAKTSMIMREKRREKLVKQHAAKRAQLKEAIRSPKSTDAEREEAQRKLNAMPRDSSASRVRNRCAITGRPRGVYRKFGLGRQKLREATMRGDIPGLGKASW